MHTPHEVLNTYFGYDSFRTGQSEVIDLVLNNKNTLSVMPTGGGKSICYQIPALLKDGTALIISPLIALMKDQVDALVALGIRATYINSSLSQTELRTRYAELRAGEYAFVYVAPERFASEFFMDLLNSIDLSLIAFDEAHCISEWGHDFRPSYRQALPALKTLDELPVIMGLTATATGAVIDDLQKVLQVENDAIVTTGFARDNLSFHVLKGRNKQSYLKEYLAKNKAESGIIYATTRKQVDGLYQDLHAAGYSVGKYHAGLNEAERGKMQEDFIRDDLQLMVATNAFGMGIDKSNVRFVIHYAAPMNIESYYQEAGRAGRDGLPSDCILLYAPQDIQMQKFLIEQSMYDETNKQAEYAKLQAMQNYAHTHGCLTSYLIHYFDPTNELEDCGRCSNCADKGEAIDITEEAQMILSCIRRMGEAFGTSMVAKVLRGSRDKRVLQFKFEDLPTYGLLKQYSEKDIQTKIQYLVAEQVLSVEGGKFPILKLNDQSLTVLQGSKPVYSYDELVEEKIVTAYHEELFEKLRALRFEMARDQGLPPYVLFSDVSLKEMSQYLPVNETDMLAIKGVGAKRFADYGETFIEAITEWIEENPDKKPFGENVQRPTPMRNTAGGETPSHIVSYEQFHAGEDIGEVAKSRDIQALTVESHIFRAVKEGHPIDWTRFFTEAEETEIIKVRENITEPRLKPMKEALSEDFTYAMIKAALVKNGYMD